MPGNPCCVCVCSSPAPLTALATIVWNQDATHRFLKRACAGPGRASLPSRPPSLPAPPCASTRTHDPFGTYCVSQGLQRDARLQLRPRSRACVHAGLWPWPAQSVAACKGGGHCPPHRMLPVACIHTYPPCMPFASPRACLCKRCRRGRGLCTARPFDVTWAPGWGGGRLCRSAARAGGSGQAAAIWPMQTCKQRCPGSTVGVFAPTCQACGFSGASGA